jgi:hypothetical protein
MVFSGQLNHATHFKLIFALSAGGRRYAACAETDNRSCTRRNMMTSRRRIELAITALPKFPSTKVARVARFDI